MNVQAAIACVFAYLLVSMIDNYMAWQTCVRPIVVGPLVGLLLGDLNTGIVMGASLEAVFMGISAIGGVVATDALTGTILSIAYVIRVGGDSAVDAGMTLAMTAGVLMNSFDNMMKPVWSMMAPFWENMAAEANPKKFRIWNLCFAPVRFLPKAIVLFVAVAFGVSGLEAALAACPAWVLTGLSAASSMMTAVGFGILLGMIWDPQICAFYFVGFVCAKSLGLSSLGIAVIGVCIALTYFFVQKNIVDATKGASSGAVSTGANSEEDFF